MNPEFSRLCNVNETKINLREIKARPTTIQIPNRKPIDRSTSEKSIEIISSTSETLSVAESIQSVKKIESGAANQSIGRFTKIMILVFNLIFAKKIDSLRAF